MNVSPKGMSTFRVLGDNDVAYLDSTGSGSETRAHLLASDQKRLTIMFCAFEGDPMIVRLYGQGQSLMRGTPEYAALLPQFEEVPGARQIVRLAVELVQTSCGMGRSSTTRGSAAVSCATGRRRVSTISENTGGSKTPVASTAYPPTSFLRPWRRRRDRARGRTMTSFAHQFPFIAL